MSIEDIQFGFRPGKGITDDILIRWMCSVSMRLVTSEEMKKLVGVEYIITDIRSGRLRWY